MAKNRHSFQLNDFGTIYTMAPFGTLKGFSQEESIPNLKSQIIGLKNIIADLGVEFEKILYSGMLSNDVESTKKIESLLDVAEIVVCERLST